MRTLSLTAIAVLFAGGSLAAYAQSAAPSQPKTTAAKTKACKGRAEADCQAPDCSWVAASKTKAGKDVAAYCRKPAKKSTSATKPS